MSSTIAIYCIMLSIWLIIINFTLNLFYPKKWNYNFFDFQLIISGIIVILISYIFYNLIYNFLLQDYSIINVIENNNSCLPILYKISAVWGSHEGSISLWIWISSCYLLFLTINKNSIYLKNAVFVNLLIIFFFLIYMMLSSNPFYKIILNFVDGAELNPLLQDPLLAIHPPLIYTGYLGSIVSFSLGIYVVNNYTNCWNILKTVTRLISSFLTLGIMLGSWWAYHELGWGGWWFWDPVENSSLMPWINNLILLHLLTSSGLTLLKRKLILIFSLIGFFLSVMATFLVRSGLFESVHSFANDSTRGIFLFFILLLICLYIIFVLNRKTSNYINKNEKKIIISILSKDFHIYFQCLMFLIFNFIVIVGTFYPTFYKFIFNQNITLGTNFYHTLLIPLISILSFALSIVPFLKWKGKSLRLETFEIIFFIFISLFVSFILYKFTLLHFLSNLIIISIILNTYFFLKFFKNISMLLAHLGFLIFLFATIQYGFLQKDITTSLKIGEIISFSDFSFIFRNLNFYYNENFTAQFSEFILKYKTSFSILSPEKRYYFIRELFSSKPYVISNIMFDIYCVLGDGNYLDGFYVKIYKNPMINWIWIGSLLIFLSTLFHRLSKKEINSINISNL